PHAEVLALRMAGEKAKGADVYVTLEPCSHHGRTPPCTEALLRARVKRVVVAMQDPNPKVSGSGMAQLEAQGVAVHSGLMETQARELNPGFISRMTRNRPFVRTKIAASLDGRTALANGESKWITGEAARTDVQHWRARSCAIMTGVCTVLADDPQMNVRDLNIGRQPLRVVADSRLRISPQAKILQHGNTLIAYATDPENKVAALRDAGAELLMMADADGRVCLNSLMAELARREINEVLVEAGQGFNGALLELDLIDEFLFYYAPVLMGSEAKGMFAMPALTEMSQRTALEVLDIRQIGQDIRLRARILAAER
ncbi:MAG TPA: bifunctional diaminohydroxyphosphoribosylaminopyrimidine deaminase/5-amino-6-(5-phosphoribosylamino)uracil reductase RibD, partial [Methylophilaceae bacterium]|nr:bifunctional diaminohydroxyphosphoribosylaminopyrimidine deaminase/5-amino-6-(5-phosphoribosylamino)uracil reductase RibD [Methylophilaceae bacterium]